MKIFSYVLVGLLMLGCTHSGEGQNAIRDEINKTAMEEFNIKRFDLNKDETGNYIFTSEDGSVITQSGNQEIGYFETSAKPGELFELKKGFFSNGKLQTKGEMYHNSFSKGKWNVYDINGKLERTVDFDEAYTYSWNRSRTIVMRKKSTYMIPTR